jgi:hypothetical protein
MTIFDTAPLMAKNALLPMPYARPGHENSSDPAHARTTPPTTGIRDRYTRRSIPCPRTARDASAEKRGSAALTTWANPTEFDDRHRTVHSWPRAWCTAMRRVPRRPATGEEEGPETSRGAAVSRDPPPATARRRRRRRRDAHPTKRDAREDNSAACGTGLLIPNAHSAIEYAAPTPNCAHPIVSGSAEEDADDDDDDAVFIPAT